MAKKKENKLSYLQMPLPEGRKSYRMVKRSWTGLNYKQTVDSGGLSMEKNISTLEAPYLVPSFAWEGLVSYENAISMFGFDGFLLVIHKKDSKILIDYLTCENGYLPELVGTGVLSTNKNDTGPRSIVQFNVYDNPTDTLTGGYVKKLLIYPDCKSMDFEIYDDFELTDLNAEVEAYTNETAPYLPSAKADKDKYYQNTFNQNVYAWDEEESDWVLSVPPGGPRLKYATVHMSRVFGVDDARVYASGYNDYTNWALDDIDEYNESNSWCSPAQSNTKADGAFTGITNFQGHVVCFKRDFMHEIYNTKNPFRIQDIYAEGAIDNRTIQDVDGRLIFVSDDNVKIYTGSNPRIISYNLNMSQYVNAVSGTDGRCYYLYCEDVQGTKHMFVYDTVNEQWSEQEIWSKILSFARNKHGLFALYNSGIGRVDTGRYDHNWEFETDFITNQTVNIKHLKKIQMLADIPEMASGMTNYASIKVYVQYDDGDPQLVYDSKERRGRLAIRVKPRNTANYGFKLRVEGQGYVKIYELELFMENGGELYV